jgi:putative endonuclease
MALVYREKLENFAKARAREAQLKRWTRAKKEALIIGDMKTLKALSRCRTSKNEV